MPRVLVLSFASLNEPHRAPYDQLGQDPEWSVHLVAPDGVALADGSTKRCDPARPGAHYTLHNLPVRFARQARFTWFSGLAKLVSAIRPEIVFAEYDPGSIAVLQAAALAPRAKRFAFSVENIERNRFRDAAKALARRQPTSVARDLTVGVLGALGELASTGIACISEDGERIFSARTKKPVHVVPLGTDMTLFCPGDGTRLRLDLGLEGAFVFGYFGRLVPEKGVHLLIEVLALLPPRFKLLLDMFKNFEPGSYAASLLERARALGVADRVVTIDVPHAQVPDCMRACDAIALPSLTTPRWKEQFGRVLPEAMACGIPVIGSTSGNIPAMVGDAGLLVPEGDAPAIADALRQLEASQDLRARLAVKGRERIRERFSIQAQVARMRELFLNQRIPRA